MKIIEKAKKFAADTKQWVSENPGAALACAFVGSFIGGYIVAGTTSKESYQEGFHKGQDSVMNMLYSEAENHGGLYEDNFRRHSDGSRMNVRATLLEK